MRRHPFLDVEPHPVGLLGMGQRMALHLAQRAQLRLVERRRPVGAAVEHRLDLAELELVGQQQVGGDDGARRAAAMERRMARALEPPEELAVAAQDAPHALGHGAAIAAADEAAGAEEGVEHEIGRPLGAADDLVEKFYGGGHPRARRHVDPLSALAATMNKPAAQRPSFRRLALDA